MQNSIVLEGRLTKEPELKKTDNDKSYVKFTIAVDRGFGSKEADFIPIKVWNKQAENIAKYKHKGDMVSVSGSLRSSSYEDPAGNKVYTYEVNASKIVYLQNAKRSNSSNNYSTVNVPKEDVSVNEANSYYDNNANDDSNNEFLKFANSANNYSW
ncbi:single-stranded DNA-binding protein [uncultured Clostridium sp.]|uniref:single-stranded DNA-binding protein n=1 Tax=uncultured Clostridium sp. TaxID=59620 RepID=UPI0028E1BFF4|nr:single-stranded DNA-binding protein [uncultured Clostridium sp.]